MQLQLDEVQPRGGLGDGMFDLQSGVHLEEIERPRPWTIWAGHELDGARTRVSDGLGGQPRGVEQLGAHAFRPLDERRGRLFDDLLMAPLDRTFAFADRPHGAVLVGHHLDLDVMTGGEVALAEHGRIAEGRLRFAACGLHLPGQRRQVVDHPHAAAAATGRGLDQHRQLVGGDGVGIEFLEHRDARGRHHLLRLDLGAHCGDRGHRRTYPREPGIDHRGGELSVLREESVSGVDCVGTGRLCGGDQLGRVEVALGAFQSHPGVRLGDVRRRRVGIGVNGDRADAELAAGVEHSASDLAAIGNQDFGDHQVHIRKTPKFDVPLIGPFAMADRHIPNTVRVSRGSITPSS